MIRHRLRKLSADTRGQAFIEFALAGPFLMLFLVGLVEVGRMLWLSHTLQYAVDETGRYAMINRTGDATALTAYLSAKLGSGENVHIEIAQRTASGVTYVSISANQPFRFAAGLFGTSDGAVAGSTSVPLLPTN